MMNKSIHHLNSAVSLFFINFAAYGSLDLRVSLSRPYEHDEHLIRYISFFNPVILANMAAMLFDELIRVPLL